MRKTETAIRKICLLTLFALSLSISLTSCFDLGTFGGNSSIPFEDAESYRDYYDSFGTVSALSTLGNFEYSLEKSLFNERTVKDLGWDDTQGDEEVSCRKYVYAAIPIKRDINIESLVLFFKPEEILSVKTPRPGEPAPEPTRLSACTLRVTAFLLESEDDVPTRFRLPGESLYEEVVEPDPATGGTKTTVKEKHFDEPSAEEAICSAAVTAKENEWTSFMLSSWEIPETGKVKAVSLTDGNVLLLRFENNSGWTENALPQCDFRFLNLLIRAKD